jgi:phage major head subunit gpT-like protein
MAIVNSDRLAGILTNFRALFQKDFDAAQAFQGWKQIAMTIDSKTLTETYEWFGTVPVMKDVTHDELTLSDLGNFNFSITNAIYKAGIEVRRDAIEDDRLGSIMPRLRQLGGEAARHPGELLFNLIEDNNNAYDGTAFFADTRVIGKSANIDNLLAGAYGDGTVAEFQAGLKAARAAMRAFQDDQGRPMNLIPNVIVVPPDLEETAWQSIATDRAGRQDRATMPANISGTFQAGGYTVITNPFLTQVDDWFVFHVAGAVKPFVYQTRIAPALEGITTPNSESGVIRDRFIYAVRARYAVGYGEPRHGVKLIDA